MNNRIKSSRENSLVCLVCLPKFTTGSILQRRIFRSEKSLILVPCYFWWTCQLQSQKMQRIDFSQPKWDQSTFVGRLKHFFWVTDPRSCVISSQQLYEAKNLVEKYKYVYNYVLINFWSAIHQSSFHSIKESPRTTRNYWRTSLVCKEIVRIGFPPRFWRATEFLW